MQQDDGLEELLARAGRWVAARLVALGPLAIVLLLFVLLRLLRWDAWWELVYEPLHLYRYWPVLLAATLALTVLWRWRRYRSSGMHRFMAVETLTLTVLVCLAAYWLTVWSVDWSVMWCTLMLGAIAVCAAALAGLLFVHCEIWRWHSGKVAQQLVRSVRSGAFLRRLKRRARRRKRTWASPHCLKLLRGNFKSTKARFIAAADTIHSAGTDDLARILEEFYSAGEALAEYLSLNYSELDSTGQPVIGDTDTRLLEQVDTLREMITAAVWANAAAPGVHVGSGRLDGWIGKLNECAALSLGSYAHALNACFRLGRSLPRAVTPADVRDVAGSFAAIGGVSRRDLSRMQDSCACTWLAVTGPMKEVCVRFDVWMTMCEAHSGDVRAPAEPSGGPDAGTALARRELLGLYGEWAGRMPGNWRSGLAGIHSYLAESHAESQPLADPWPQFVRESSRIHSWPYREAWTLPGAWLAPACAAAVMFVAFAAAITHVNPRLPASPGLNAIDHFSDPRPGRSEAADVMRNAMAGNGRWAVECTSAGAVVVNLRSRIRRAPVGARQALDAAPHPSGGFAVLYNDQSIDRVMPPLGYNRTPASIPWVPGPEKLVLTGASGDIRLLASALELLPSEAGGVQGTPPERLRPSREGGWLVAVQGHGLAAYLFDTLPGGGAWRRRLWQTSDSWGIDLQDARMTSRGAWLRVPQGFRYADRESLAIVPAGSIDIPGVRTFDAQYSGSSAWILDESGGVWLHPSEGIWQGPFLGGRASIQSAGEVVAVGESDRTAWMAATGELLAYNTARRSIRTFPIQGIHTIAGKEPAYVLPGEIDQEVLAAGSEGIVSLRPAAEPGEWISRTIEGKPVGSTHLAPDGEVCVYTVGAADSCEVRAMVSPFAPDEISTLIPARGWKKLEQPPRLAGAAASRSLLVLAGADGAFIYDPQTHSYRDFSSARLVRGNPAVRSSISIRDFAQLQRGGERFLAIGDGRPLAAADDADQWEVMDPNGQTRPSELAESAGKIYGLRPDGEIHTYKKLQTWGAAASICSRGSSALAGSDVPAGQAVCGDLDTSGRWRMALAAGGSVCRYSSATGNWSETRAAEIADGRVVQVRLLDEHCLLVKDDGTMRDINTGRSFRNADMPAAPDTFTAIAPGPVTDTILAAGREVHVYDWRQGTWARFGSRGFWAAPAGARVAELQHTPAGTFARYDNGSVYHAPLPEAEGIPLKHSLEVGAWRPMQGCNGWAYNEKRGVLWLLGGAGIARRTVEPDSDSVAFSAPQFCSGFGMQNLVEHARYAWQPEENSVIFFSEDVIGRYCTASETYTSVRRDELQQSSIFAPHAGELLVLSGNSLVRVDRELAVQEDMQIPADARNACMRVVDGSPLLAYVQKGSVVVHDVQRGAEQRRGGSSGMEDPSRVVYAAEVEGELLLADEAAHCMKYDVKSGRWRNVWAPSPTYAYFGSPADKSISLQGWIRLPGGNGVIMVVKTGARHLLAPVVAGSAGTYAELGIPLDDAFSLFAWAGERLAQQQAEDGEGRPAEDLAGRSLLYQADGLLLDTQVLNIVRVHDQARYSVSDSSDYRPFEPQPDGISKNEFDPSAAAWAGWAGDCVLVVDDCGGAAEWSLDEGGWRLIRRRVPGQGFYGRLSSGSEPPVFVMQAADERGPAAGGSALVAVSDGACEEQFVPLPAADLVALLRWQAALWGGEADIPQLQRPANGLLLKTPVIRVKRENGRTTCDLGSDKSPAPLKPARLSAVDAHTIVFVWRSHDTLVFVDEAGGAAAWSWTAGSWRVLREPSANQQVAALIPSKRPNEALLLLTDASGKTSIVPFRNGSFEPAHTTRAAPHEVHNLLKWADNLLVLAGCGLELLSNLTVVEPSAGVLLDTDAIRIARGLSGTSFELKFGERILELHTRQHGFAEDAASHIALTAGGSVWMLPDGLDSAQRLIRLEAGEQRNLVLTPDTAPIDGAVAAISTTPAGNILLEYEGGASEILAENDRHQLEALPQEPDVLLASLNYGQTSLLWKLSRKPQAPGCRIEASWQAADGRTLDLPVWGEQGKLAPQCVNSIASADGNLIVACDAGVMVRDSGDFSLKALYPEIRDAELFRMHGPQRVVAVGRNGAAREWLADATRELPREERSPLIGSIRTGPWLWHTTFAAGAETSISIRHSSDGRSRKWTDTGMLRFNDDIVNWVAREGDRAWLATEDGLWQYSIAAGRSRNSVEKLGGRKVRRAYFSEGGGTLFWLDDAAQWHQFTGEGDRPITEPPAAECELKTPALGVFCRLGTLTFSTPDDGPAIVGGRIYHDRTAHFCSSANTLHCLVPGRAVVQRSGSDPSRIGACRPLPKDVSPEQPIRLRILPSEAGGGRLLRLEQPAGEPLLDDFWELRADGWTAKARGPRRPEAELGIFQWFCTGGPGSLVVPQVKPQHLLLPAGTPLVWWSGDRFAWDSPSACAAMESIVDNERKTFTRRIVMATRAGIVVLELTPDSRHGETVALAQLEGLQFCTTARKDRELAGVVAGGADEFPQYLIKPAGEQPADDAQGRAQALGLEVAIITDGESCRCDATLAFTQTAGDDAFITPVLLHLGRGGTEEEAIGRLISLVPAVPTERLIVDGKFAFDRWTAGCELPADEGRSRWASSAPLDSGEADGEDDAGILCVNELRGSLLALRVVRDGPAGVQVLRPLGNGRVAGMLSGDAEPPPTPETGVAGGGAVTIMQCDLNERESRWEAAAVSETAAAFQKGEAVTLSVGSLEWFSRPTFEWDSLAPFRTDPPDYRLFCSVADGVVLAFDYITSLAACSEPQRMALGTLGGVILSPYDSGKGMLALSSRLLFNCGNGQPLYDIQRLRRSHDGLLWAQAGEDLRTAVLLHADTDGWFGQKGGSPFDETILGDHRIAFEHDCLRVDGVLHRYTLDALPSERKPLADCVGYYSDADGSFSGDQAIWLCTRRSGLIKMLPAHLPNSSSILTEDARF